MRKRTLYVHIFTILTLLSFFMSVPSQTFGNWGMEAGRANEGDIASLLVDQLAMKMAQNRISEAISRPLGVERKLALLGKSTSIAPDDLLDQVHKWWMKDVMGPATAIVGNPAASCAEAEVSMRTLLGMMRQRQLVMSSTDEDAELGKMFDDIQAKGFERCRDEALDECVATGRIMQIPQTAFSQARQSALLGDNFDAEAWAKDSLKQCGIYELHFVSTTHIDQAFKLDTVLDGKIKLKFVEDGGPMLGMTLRGETEGGNNPFLVSIKCRLPAGVSVTCAPGATPSSFEAMILEMELKHREFFTGVNDVVAERIVADDKLVVEFRAGTLMVEMVIRPPIGPSVTTPFPVGTPFFTAHYKDRVGQTQTVKFERNKRGVYPLVFDFIYADQDTVSNVPVTDSTHFELIHKIPDEVKKKLYPPRKAEPPRKPLKPRTRIGG